jgi:hypothetical protein
MSKSKERPLPQTLPGTPNTPENRDMQDGLPPVPEDQYDTGPTVAQAELEGKTFHRRPEEQAPTRKKKVRIIAGQDEQTAENIFQPIDKTPPTIIPADLPHLPLDQTEAWDTAFDQPPSLKTVRKRGSSKPFVDTKKPISRSKPS